MSLLTRPLTVDDLDQFPDDGKRREIIEGELYVSPAPSRAHQTFSSELHNLFHQTVVVTGWGRVYSAPVDVRFSAEDQVQPDLLVIRRDRLDMYRGNTVFGPPDIVVEILSPSNRAYDLVTKARLYAAANVPELWIADPDEPGLRISALSDGQYHPVEPAADGTLRSTVVPGLVVALTDLFASLAD